MYIFENKIHLLYCRITYNNIIKRITNEFYKICTWVKLEINAYTMLLILVNSILLFIIIFLYYVFYNRYSS